MGRHQEALARAEEAVKIYRQLAQFNPPFLANLDGSLVEMANSLHNLGNRLTELGRHKEALAAMEEAVKITHKLAKTNPALPVLAMRNWPSIYQYALAVSLGSLGIVMNNLVSRPGDLRAKSLELLQD